MRLLEGLEVVEADTVVGFIRKMVNNGEFDLLTEASMNLRNCLLVEALLRLFACFLLLELPAALPMPLFTRLSIKCCS